MTTVAAARLPNGDVGIIADSAVTGRVQYRADVKLLEIGRYVIGIAGIILDPRRLVCAVADGLDLQEDDDNPEAFLDGMETADAASVLSQAMASLMRGDGHGSAEDTGGHWHHPNDAILIAQGDGPYVLSCDGTVFKPDEGYCAIGSGHDIALGALAVADMSRDLEDVLIETIRAAEKHDPYTRAPYYKRLYRAQKNEVVNREDQAAEPVPTPGDGF